MLDLSDLLDRQTEFPKVWKSLVREVLLKFEDGITYHHENIAGCRPYKVDLKITIDDCVGDDEYEQLHKMRKDKEALTFLYADVFNELVDIVAGNGLMTDELKDNLNELGVDLEET